jgi:hypothetical protein
LADHLTERAGYWHFQRRVPKEYAALDPRGVIRNSTKVSVKEDRRGIKAKKIADAMNREVEAYWRALHEGKAQEATERYNTRRRARTLGLDFAETAELGSRATLVLERLEKITAGLVENLGARAALGYEKRPSVKLSKVFSKDETQTRNELKDTSPKHRKKGNKPRAQPIASVLVKNLVALAKELAKATGNKITTVGTNSTGTATFYTDLESGRTSCTLRKYDLLTDWFEENWPEGHTHTMPKLVDPKHYP